MSTMTLKDFHAAFAAGGLRSVGVTAAGGLFFVTGMPRDGEAVTLSTTSGRQARGFRDLLKAIALLHEIGARKVEVDTSNWSPDHAIDSAPQEAGAHDAWFRGEVEAALRETEDPTTLWLSNDEVNGQSRVQRDRWQQRAM